MLHVYRPVLEVLMQRGIQDPHNFLRPSQWDDLPAPSTIEGIAEATPFLLGAIRDGLKITVYGDYDCDGALSSAILEATLARIGAAVDVYLPHRDEGYGLSESAVHRFSRSGTKVLVAIDNGINAAGPVHLAQRLGMTVLVIDHHQIKTRAGAQAVWSDKFCAARAIESACGGTEGVSGQPKPAGRHRFYCRLCSAGRRDTHPYTAWFGGLSRTTHAGLRKLMELGGIMPAKVPSAEEVAFRIGPRLNAAGRVGQPNQGLAEIHATSMKRLLRIDTTDDPHDGDGGE